MYSVLQSTDTGVLVRAQLPAAFPNVTLIVPFVGGWRLFTTTTEYGASTYYVHNAICTSPATAP